MTAKHATDLDSQVGLRVRLYRQQSGLSQTDLGNQLGITFQQVQKYEKGANRIGAGRLFEIARILHVPITAMYPEAADAAKPVVAKNKQLDVFAAFSESAELWLLVRTFSRIPSPKHRKTIIELVRQLSDAGEDATCTDKAASERSPVASRLLK